MWTLKSDLGLNLETHNSAILRKLKVSLAMSLSYFIKTKEALGDEVFILQGTLGLNNIILFIFKYVLHWPSWTSIMWYFKDSSMQKFSYNIYIVIRAFPNSKWNLL